MVFFIANTNAYSWDILQFSLIKSLDMAFKNIRTTLQDLN